VRAAADGGPTAVRCICDAASSLPIHAYRRTEQGRERVTSGRLVELLDKPGPSTTQADLVSTLIAHLLIYGGAYLASTASRATLRSSACSVPSRSRPSSRTAACAS
jgi:phage portal protein BeeE